MTHRDHRNQVDVEAQADFELPGGQVVGHAAEAATGSRAVAGQGAAGIAVRLGHDLSGLAGCHRRFVPSPVHRAVETLVIETCRQQQRSIVDFVTPPSKPGSQVNRGNLCSPGRERLHFRVRGASVPFVSRHF